MFPYFVLIFIPLFICIFEDRVTVINSINSNKHKIEGLSVLLFFFIFFVILSLRGIGCGIDLKNYLYYFTRYSAMSWKQVIDTNGLYDVELGFRLFSKLVSCISNNFQIYIAFVALLSVAPVYLLYKSGVRSYGLTIVLFLGIAPFSLYFSGLRQAIAMGFAYPAYLCARDKKLLLFIIFIVSASLFHTSALIMLLLYPIYRANITKKWLYVVIPGMLVVLIFNRSIFGVLLVFLENTRYESYSIGATGAYGMLFLLVALSIAVLVLTVDTENTLTNDDIGLRNILLLSTCLQFFAPLSHVAMRMNYYYMLFLPIAIPRLIQKASNRYKQVASLMYVVLFAFFLIQFIYGMYYSEDILQVFPYVPFWKQL